MITRLLILVALVWSLCPFIPLLPLPYQGFYAVSAFCFAFSRRFIYAIYAAILFAALAFGIGQLNTIGKSQLPLELEDSFWQGEVKIQQIRAASAGNYAQVQAQIIATSSIDASAINFNGKIISLGWPNTPELQQGQHWSIAVKLRRLQGLLNPAGVDFTAINLSQGVRLNGQVQSSPAPRQVDVSLTPLDRIQNYFKHTLGQAQAADFARFYLALALGDTSGLTQQDWQILQNTGTVHLMAISGFQIGLMASIGFWLGIFIAKPIGLALTHSARWSHWPSRIFPVLFSVTFASFYTFLANFSLPAERAWVACLLLNTAWLFGVRASLGQLWLLCCVIALYSHPLAPLNTGFWLSYCAVGTLLYLSCKKTRANILTQSIEAQWLITIALIMPQLALTIPLSTTGFAANLIVAPWIAIVITPLVFILLALSPLMDVSLGFLGLDYAYLIAWWLLEHISHLPATLWWPCHSLTWLDYTLAAIATLLLILPRSLGFFNLGLILMSICLFVPRHKNNFAAVHLLDVGQGLAVLIQTAHHTVLFDTGPSFSARFDAGTHILSPYLMQLGVHDIDIIISRDNAEHAGGLRGLKQFNWLALSSGEPLAQYPAVQLCQQSIQGNWDFVHWEMIAPVAGYEDYSRSCAIKLTIGPRSVYLFGDISTAQQREILKKENNCCAYIVLTPGQGAKNQHLAKMAEQLKPTYAVFSNGAHNRYHHPHQSALESYQQAGATTLITAQTGALKWYWKDADTEPRLTSQWPNRQRYWYPRHGSGNLPEISLSD